MIKRNALMNFALVIAIIMVFYFKYNINIKIEEGKVLLRHDYIFYYVIYGANTCLSILIVGMLSGLLLRNSISLTESKKYIIVKAGILIIIGIALYLLCYVPYISWLVKYINIEYSILVSILQPITKLTFFILGTFISWINLKQIDYKGE